MSISYFEIWENIFSRGEEVLNRLKEIREDNDLLQKDIAKYLNMSQNGYSLYENETRDIPTDVLKKLANYYKTSIDYLLYETDTRKPYPKSILKES